ncbi:MAG: hypothetical protein ACKO5E_07390, partial [bacterium]
MPSRRFCLATGLKLSVASMVFNGNRLISAEAAPAYAAPAYVPELEKLASAHKGKVAIAVKNL